MVGGAGEIEIEVTDRSSGQHLLLRATRVGRDVVATVAGGGRPHVGSCVMAQPWPSRSQPGAWSPSVSVLTIPPHKEEPLARAIAERLCRSTGAVAVVTAGVHDDGLDAVGIAVYERLGRELDAELAARILDTWGEAPPSVGA